MKTARIGIILWAAGVITLLGSCASAPQLYHKTGITGNEEVIGSVKVEYTSSQSLKTRNEAKKDEIRADAEKRLIKAFQSDIKGNSKVFQNEIDGDSEIKNIVIQRSGFSKITATGDVVLTVPRESPPVSLTAAILRRLQDQYGKDLDGIIDKIQLFLGSRATLERDIMVVGDAVQSDGTIRFAQMRTTETINFRNRTEGQAVAIFEDFEDVIILHIGFEKENNYHLSFKCVAIDDGGQFEPAALFFLEYNEDSTASDSVKGTYIYGNNEYKVSYTGDKPYLLINLAQIDNLNTNSRTASGRKVPLPPF